MNHNIILALLVHLELIDRDKGSELADRLTHGIQPARFDDAERIIKDIFEKLDK